MCRAVSSYARIPLEEKPQKRPRPAATEAAARRASKGRGRRERHDGGFGGAGVAPELGWRKEEEESMVKEEWKGRVFFFSSFFFFSFKKNYTPREKGRAPNEINSFFSVSFRALSHSPCRFLWEKKKRNETKRIETQ